MRIKKTTIILFAFFALFAILVLITPSSKNEYTIKKLSDLSYRTVGVTNGSSYENLVLAKNPDAEIEIYADVNAMILSVLQGKLDAIVTEDITYNVMKIHNPDVRALEETVGKAYFSSIFATTDKGRLLYEQYEEYIRRCENDGTSERLGQYWGADYDPDTSRSDSSGITGENGVINVAITAGVEGFSYEVEGELSGYDIDFMYGFCRAYGYEPNFIQLEFDAITPAILGGKADVGMSIVYTKERADDALLSSPYSSNDIYVVVCDNVSEKSFGETLQESFYGTFIKEDRWKMLLEGTGITLLITVLSVIIGSVMGYYAYILCMDGDKISQKIIDAISWVLNALPTVLFLMILYYIIFGTKEANSIAVAIGGFSLMFACSVFGMIGTGVQALGKGQYEAARAQGFSDKETFKQILFPQAVYLSLPSYKSGVVSLLKETSVVGYIAIMDLTKMSDIIRNRTFDAFFPLIASAFIYMLLIILLTHLISLIEPKVDIKKRKIPQDLIEEELNDR